MTAATTGALLREGDSQLQERRRRCLSSTACGPTLVLVVVDDDAPGGHDLVTAWRDQPVEIHQVPDLASALMWVGQLCPDAVLIGHSQQSVSVRQFLSVVRTADPNLPILVGITADPGVQVGPQVTAMVPYPFQPQLLPLITSLVDQRQHVQLRPAQIDLGRLRLDGEVPRVWLDGTEITLPMMEFLLLRYLAERGGAVVSREEIIERLWHGDPRAAAGNTVTVHIRRLRRRLGDDAYHPTWIQAVRGMGYRLRVPDLDR